MLGGSVIYELWALPSWATVPYNGAARHRHVEQAHQASGESRRIRAPHRHLLQEGAGGTGSAPAIVGIENEVDQPPEVFSAMALALRRELDKAGFTATKIHMADASYMFLGIDRATELRKNPDGVEGHRLRRRARVRLSGVPRQSRPLRRAHEADARGRGRQALPRHGNLHQRSALPGALVPHRLRRGAALPQEPDRTGRSSADVLLAAAGCGAAHLRRFALAARPRSHARLDSRARQAFSCA